MKAFDLQKFRKDYNLSQVEIAEVLNCRQSFISRVERGVRPLPENMMEILQLKFGDISGYISEIEENKKDTFSIESTPQEFLMAGADAFTRQLVKMMNDKLIAPYGLLAEKEEEIERLNRLVGKLEGMLEQYKGITKK